MDRDTNKEGLRFPLRYNLIGIDCNSWGLPRSLTLVRAQTHTLFDAHAFLKAEHNNAAWQHFQTKTRHCENKDESDGLQTCLDWVKSRTRWPCLNHRRSRDSTTISFPERFQNPKCSSSESWSSGIPLNNRGPPEKRSGWLQILRSAINPEKTWASRKNNR